MTTTRKFSHTPPDKANELLDRLLATRDTAAKARERLLTELKEELDLLANLQEQHLFPILRKHGMDDLVREATSDTQVTASLLNELERMPKNNQTFHAKVSELQTVFQQHLRVDRKELLPAVLRVLSDEEADAVVEKVEDDMASIEESRQAEARRGNDRVEIVQQVADDMTEAARAGADGALTVAQTVQEAVQTGLRAASELARISSEQTMGLFTRSDSKAQPLGDKSPLYGDAISQTGKTFAFGVQDVSRECLELSQKRLRTNLEGLSSLTQCRSIPEFLAIQTSLIRDNLEQTFDNGRRIAELTRRLADETTRTVKLEAERAARHARR